MQESFDSIRLVLFGRDDKIDADSFFTRLSGEGVDADHLGLDNLKDAGEQPLIFGGGYLELPGHSVSFIDRLSTNEKATNVDVGGCWVSQNKKRLPASIT